MKIRLGIIDNDGMYKTRLINYFNANYADKLEIFSFSTLENLKQYMQESNLDVLLADEESVPDTEEIPAGVAFAYWSDSANIDSIRNKRTVCKYQKAELIYKEILGLYAEIDNNVTSYKLDGSGGAVLTFMGAAGGVECIVCVKALEEGFIHQTMGTTETEGEMDLDYTIGAPKERKIRYAMSNSLGFGGHNVSLIVKRYEE